jgi:hypothetical protein
MTRGQPRLSAVDLNAVALRIRGLSESQPDPFAPVYRQRAVGGQDRVLAPGYSERPRAAGASVLARPCFLCCVTAAASGDDSPYVPGSNAPSAVVGGVRLMSV